MYLGGWHTLKALIDRCPERIETLFLTDRIDASRELALLRLAQTQGISIDRSTEAYVSSRLKYINHQGIMAKIRPFAESSLEEWLLRWDKSGHNPCLVILDRVQDPQNLGACLRAAAAFSCDGIIVPRRRSASMNATVAKVASGAHIWVPVITVANTARAIQQMQSSGIWVYAMAEDAGQSLVEADCRRAHAWVLGNEGQGVGSLVRSVCDACYTIPVNSRFQTLNVAMSTSICLYESFRASR